MSSGNDSGRDGPDRNKLNPRVAELGRDLDRLRQEVELAARASQQESQGLGVAVREILSLLRRLAMQSRAAESMQVPVPFPVPSQGREPGAGQGPSLLPGPGQMPGPAQMPGRNRSPMAPGRSNR